MLKGGEYVIIKQVEHEILEAPVRVYNLNVAEWHTYYVAEPGIIVHNSCNHNSYWNKERRNYWKTQSKIVEKNTYYGAYTATEKNIERMRKGLAPIGWDNKSVELHHWKGILNDFYDYSPVSRALHQLIHMVE